ncbi:hypothetical protein [Streptomyces sp. SID3343]|nr:hypothetical protein [Streptomyces sp. SID3343]MYW00025.1 hypothetical protein [Streptomyces sp. SID3343]
MAAGRPGVGPDKGWERAGHMQTVKLDEHAPDHGIAEQTIRQGRRA